LPVNPRHGNVVPRGLETAAAADAVGGRFGRMFPDLAPCEVSDAAIDALVALMRRRDPMPTNTRIPSGFTYFAQFVDHDITFDPTSKLDQISDPLALENFRTPRLDLDSVYGSGPVVQPYLYDWMSSQAPPGVRMLIASTEGFQDLPRNRQGRALIGDARNDEHAIITQLHLLFLRFHNRVAQHLAAGGTGEGELLEAAQQAVRRHYRWVVARELLPALTGLPGPVEPEYLRFAGPPFIPVEFSGAAFRIGHSMIRAQYGLQLEPEVGELPPASPIFPALDGFHGLQPKLVIDWPRFFRMPGFEQEVQPSQRINTHIVGPLFKLPDGGGELPRRNLQRGRILGVPSGQAVAGELEMPLLTDTELQLDSVPAAVRDELHESMPLWFYVLCEAQVRADGRHLGPVGALIVAEVLSALLALDAELDAGWTPGELGTGNDFTMASLIRFAQTGGA
jgi:hypothetical protein